MKLRGVVGNNMLVLRRNSGARGQETLNENKSVGEEGDTDTTIISFTGFTFTSLGDVRSLSLCLIYLICLI